MTHAKPFACLAACLSIVALTFVSGCACPKKPNVDQMGQIQDSTPTLTQSAKVTA